MYLNKLAEQYHDSWIKKQGEVTQFNNGCMVGFRDGFLAATQWHPMDSAPKDYHILIAYKYMKDSHIDVGEGFWDSSIKEWCYERERPLGEVIAWMEMPIYKPENQ